MTDNKQTRNTGGRLVTDEQIQRLTHEAEADHTNTSEGRARRTGGLAPHGLTTGRTTRSAVVRYRGAGLRSLR